MTVSLTVEHDGKKRPLTGRLALYVLYLMSDPELARDLDHSPTGKLVGTWNGDQIKCWLEKYYQPAGRK